MLLGKIGVVSKLLLSSSCPGGPRRNTTTTPLCVASGFSASLTAPFSVKDRSLCVCVCVCATWAILAQAEAWGSSDSFSGRLVIWPGYGHRGHRLRAVVGDWLSHYFVLKATKLAIQCGFRRDISRSHTRKEQKAPSPIYLGCRCSTAAIPYLGNSKPGHMRLLRKTGGARRPFRGAYPG